MSILNPIPVNLAKQLAEDVLILDEQWAEQIELDRDFQLNREIEAYWDARQAEDDANEKIMTWNTDEYYFG